MTKTQRNAALFALAAVLAFAAAVIEYVRKDDLSLGLLAAGTAMAVGAVYAARRRPVAETR